MKSKKNKRNQGNGGGLKKQRSFLRSVTVSGFKSIKSLEGLKLGPLNILIGANGAGKSNFIEALWMMRAYKSGQLEYFAGDLRHQSGLDDLPYAGWEATPEIYMEFEADRSVGMFDFFLEKGKLSCQDSGSFENDEDEEELDWIFKNAVYMPQVDMEYMRSPAVESMMAVLLEEHSASEMKDLMKIFRLMMPFFEGFEIKDGDEKKKIAWRQKGMKRPMSFKQLPEGALRLLEILLVLRMRPSLLLMDKPELGLHFETMVFLAEALKTLSPVTQVVMETQSPFMLSQFKPEDVIMVRREKGASVFERPDMDEIKPWLEDGSLGSLWLKNVLRAGTEAE
ncbi:MAG: AAA family ATPase [Clostridia bacterium]|nr:AAA family ATPase [Clostridia bacterium]